LKKVLTVARWEYLEKVRSKAFLIGLLLTPLIMVGMGVLPGLFATQEDQITKTVGVIDQSGDMAVPFAARMQERYLLDNGQPNYIILPLGIGEELDMEAAVRDANRRVVNDEIEGYCLVRTTILSDSVVEYRSKAVGDFRIAHRVKETLKEIITEKRSASLGLDPTILTRLQVKLDVRTIKLSTSGEEEDSGFLKVFFTAYLFLMMLFFLIVTSGQLLVRSVIEEKSNRIVEVLISSCSPTELMAGKVLGLSALGLTQMGFWALIGFAVSISFGLDLIAPGQALLLAIYFILGYLFYAAVFIAAGSPLTTEQEAQQVTSYLVIFLIVPIVLAIPAIKTPDATWLKVMTYIPLFTPTMMALRIPIQTPPLWEILSTIALMAVSIYLAMVVAGRIFRIAILSTGKTQTLTEIMQWARRP
jgi:ABC-2 type transport system permease protein